MKRYNVMIKPASASCNMRCRYCFYTDESSSRQTASYGLMSREVVQSILEKFFSQPAGGFSFAFQGGEPTLAGLPFFQRFMDAEKSLSSVPIKAHHAMQTNGVLLDGVWADFLKENDFLVGLSLDGTRDIHNYFRVGADGKGSYQRTLAAAELLKRRRVPFNILTVVTPAAARHINAIFQDYKKRGFTYQQYIPCLAPLDGEANSFTPEPKLLASFWKRLFDLWHQELVQGNYISIRFFDNLVYMLQGKPPELCSMCGHCTIQYLIEADGSVFPCDFYALDEYRLGNILTDTLDDIDRRREELRFIQDSLQPPQECRGCRWAFLCRNGCRRERDRAGKSIHCAAYREFFPYAYRRLAQAAARFRME